MASPTSGQAIGLSDIPPWMSVDEEGRIWTSHKVRGRGDGPLRRAEYGQSAGEAQTVIARSLGVHKARVWEVVHGKVWKHVA